MGNMYGLMSGWMGAVMVVAMLVIVGAVAFVLVAAGRWLWLQRQTVGRERPAASVTFSGAAEE